MQGSGKPPRVAETQFSRFIEGNTWIDGWYNAKRRHSALGYISPLEYERRQLSMAA